MDYTLEYFQKSADYIRERIPFLDERTKNNSGEEEHYDIASAADLKNFADMVNSGKNSISATLTRDIDYSNYSNEMIGKSTHFRGTFDGNGHSIKVKINASQEYAALFRYLDGTVKNLTVTGTISTSAKFAAGIAGSTDGGRIEHCTADVTITSTKYISSQPPRPDHRLSHPRQHERRQHRLLRWRGGLGLGNNPHQELSGKQRHNRQDQRQ